MKNSTARHHILFLVPLPPPVHGSAVMSQQIMDSSVFRSCFVCDFVNISTSRTMGEVSHFNIKKPLRYLIILFKVLSKLLFHKYDACYIALTCHGKGFLKDAPFALLCKAFGNKLIIHQHNKGMSNDVDRPLFRWLYPLVYNNAKVILLSWYLYPDIEKVVKRENVMICPNGIKPTADPNFVHTPNKVPHILFLSNLLIDKGVLVLLDALKILKDKGYSFVCDFVGCETHDISAQRFADEVEKRGLNQIAIYHGRKLGDEKRFFFEKAEVFVFPTFYSNECFPLVILEAMQYGIPVITTDEGGIPDIVEESKTGFIVPKHDAFALADKIEYLINSPDLSYSMGQTGLKKYREKFQLEIWENRLCNILKSLCN